MKKPIVFLSLACLACIQAHAIFTITISPRSNGQETQVAVSWDGSLDPGFTLASQLNDPVDGSVLPTSYAKVLFEPRLADVGDFIKGTYDSSFFFPGFAGVTSTASDLGIYLDDSRRLDRFAIVVDASVGSLPSTGSYVVRMPAPAVGFENVFNFGTYTNGSSTLTVAVPEPGTYAGIFGILALSFVAIRRRARRTA